MLATVTRTRTATTPARMARLGGDLSSNTVGADPPSEQALTAVTLLRRRQRRGPFGLRRMCWGTAQQARREAAVRLQLEAAFAFSFIT